MLKNLGMGQPNYNDSKYNADLSPMGAFLGFWAQANLALHVNPAPIPKVGKGPSKWMPSVRALGL